MASQFPARQRDLIAALQDFIQNIDKLNPHQISKALEKFSDELGQLTRASHNPHTQIYPVPSHSCSESEQTLQAVLHYPDPEALSRELPALLDLRGISLVTDERPPLLDWITLRITCADKTDSVELLARVVQYTPNGLALEIEPVCSQARTQLLVLATKPIQDRRFCSRFIVPPTPHDPNKFIESEGEPLNRYNLEHTDLETILLEISHRRGFGLLQIQHAAHTWQIIHLHHQIVDIQHFPLSNKESLVDLLLESKNLTREQYDQAYTHALSHDTEPENALVELGFLSETRLAQAHKARIMLLLHRLFERSVGHVVHFALTYPPAIANIAALHELALVSIPNRIFHHLHTRYQKQNKEHLLVAAQQLNNHLLTIHESLCLPIATLNLDAQLKAIAIALKDTPKTLSELIQTNTLPPSRIIALCLALERTGLLKKEAIRRLPTPSGPPLSPDESSPNTHFAQLGLHWSTYDQEIQRKYHQLSEQSHAEHPDQDCHKPILDAVTQAYEAIRNPACRTRYRNSIVDAFTIETALITFRKQAENAKLNRDIDTAIDACCRIIELDPDDSSAREDLKTLRPLKRWSNSQQPDQSL